MVSIGKSAFVDALLQALEEDGLERGRVLSAIASPGSIVVTISFADFAAAATLAVIVNTGFSFSVDDTLFVAVPETVSSQQVDPPNQPTFNSGEVVGGIIAGICSVLVLLAFVVWSTRRRSNAKPSASENTAEATGPLTAETEASPTALEAAVKRNTAPSMLDAAVDAADASVTLSGLTAIKTEISVEIPAGGNGQETINDGIVWTTDGDGGLVSAAAALQPLHGDDTESSPEPAGRLSEVLPHRSEPEVLAAARAEATIFSLAGEHTSSPVADMTLARPTRNQRAQTHQLPGVSGDTATDVATLQRSTGFPGQPVRRASTPPSPSDPLPVAESLTSVAGRDVATSRTPSLRLPSSQRAERTKQRPRTVCLHGATGETRGDDGCRWPHDSAAAEELLAFSFGAGGQRRSGSVDGALSSPFERFLESQRADGGHSDPLPMRRRSSLI